MEKYLQNKHPLEEVVKRGDFIIIEKVERNKVVDRQAGFFWDSIGGRISLVNFDNNLSPKQVRESGLSPEILIPENGGCPKLTDITQYYIIPYENYN